QEMALAALGEEATGSGERGNWAKVALQRMTDRLAGKARGLGDDYLSLADADDPYLRELFALSLNFWDGDSRESQQIEATLDRLSGATGRVEEFLAERAEESDAPTQSLTKSPGLRVRYNATTAPARRGGKLVNLAILKEMLDESTQKEYWRRKLSDGKDVSDEGAA